MTTMTARLLRQCQDWSLIPDSILLNVFSYLSAKDLIRASSVCRRWRKLSQDNSLWCRLLSLDYVTYGDVVPQAAEFQGKHYELYLRLFASSPQVRTCKRLKLPQGGSLQPIRYVCIAHDGLALAIFANNSLHLWNTYAPFERFSSAVVIPPEREYETALARFNADDSMIFTTAVNDETNQGIVAVYTVDEAHRLSLRFNVETKATITFLDWMDATHLLGYRCEVMSRRNRPPVQSLRIYVCDTNDAAWTVRRSATVPLVRLDQQPRDCMILVGSFISVEAHLAADFGEVKESDLAGSYMNIDQIRPLVREECCTFCSIRRLNNIAPNQHRLCECQTRHDDRLLIFVTSDCQIAFKVLRYSLVQRVLSDRGKTGRQIRNRRARLRRRRRNDSAATSVTEAEPVVIVRNRCMEISDFVINMNGIITDFVLSSDSQRLFVSVTMMDPVEVLYCIVDLGKFEMTHSFHTLLSAQALPRTIVADVNSSWLICKHNGSIIGLWDLSSRYHVASLLHNNSVVAAVFHPRDPEMLITLSGNSTMNVWRSRRRMQEIRDILTRA